MLDLIELTTLSRSRKISCESEQRVSRTRGIFESFLVDGMVIVELGGSRGDLEVVKVQKYLQRELNLNSKLPEDGSLREICLVIMGPKTKSTLASIPKRPKTSYLLCPEDR